MKCEFCEDKIAEKYIEVQYVGPLSSGTDSFYVCKSHANHFILDKENYHIISERSIDNQ